MFPCIRVQGPALHGAGAARDGIMSLRFAALYTSCLHRKHSISGCPGAFPTLAEHSLWLHIIAHEKGRVCSPNLPQRQP